MRLAASTSSPDETRALAAAVAALVRPDDVVVLAGDLGAGKTAFAQGFGAALGVVDPITSPTFTLANEYVGQLTLHHLDVYRLERLGEVEDLGLVELLDSGGVTLIEWGDAIAPLLPPDRLDVRLMLGDGDDDRMLHFELAGPRWAERSAALRAALAPWLAPDPPDPPRPDGHAGQAAPDGGPC